MTNLLNDEFMDNIVGGYNVDDLSPEDFAELEALGGQIIEMQIMKRKNDPNYDVAKYKNLCDQMMELDKRLREKYGN